MLLPGGIWTGVIVTYAIERTHLWARMPPRQFAIDFRRSLSRVDPMQPILGIVTILGAGLFALHSSGTARALGWGGCGLVALVVSVSVSLAEPINSQFRRCPEGEPPADADRLRVRWTRIHLVRTVFAVAALGALVVAVSYAP